MGYWGLGLQHTILEGHHPIITTDFKSLLKAEFQCMRSCSSTGSQETLFLSLLFRI